ncbi:hypothetical protein AU210_016722 [Fusarium oxysporum f. sp. radicis-cucumerinum]|uniref:Vid27 N-terminal domain-containing protein n=1 Tax=Fusarium oxysporum f. sp. radicis-cucumerinum TaxID=327505 RepID=A0A2H3FJV2_FUSOX|nr:hypothetical protein AU210_016722 [Fusarium oxysporum f. sp. radicis-cucumerinum]
MFALRKFSGLIVGHGTRETLSELPHGQLHLIRPLSSRGYSQLVFRDSAIYVLPGRQRFQYQLIVKRAKGIFEETGAHLLAEEEGEFVLENGEKTFLLDESLIFGFEIRESGDKVLTWKDPISRPDDIFQFICDSSIALEEIQQFVRVAQQCQCEHRYRTTDSHVAASDLAQFELEQAELLSFIDPPERHTQDLHFGSADHTRDESATSYTTEQEPVAVSQEEGYKTDVPQVYAQISGELYRFVPERRHFSLFDDSVVASFLDIGDGKCWLQIEGRDRVYVETQVAVTLNPVFDFNSLSFVFNYSSSGGHSQSCLLRPKDRSTLETLQELIMRAIGEDKQRIQCTPTQDGEPGYVLSALDFIKEQTLACCELFT